ncbi:MAG: MFS transporter [Bacillota bacterium]|nr:MFS transporter [Bacillota bacterium]
MFKSKSSVDKNSLFFIYEGIAITIIINIANPFFTMFGKRMGAGDYQIGLISSIPALMGILAVIPGAMLVGRFRDKKKVVAVLALCTGILYPIAAFTPFTGTSRVFWYIIAIAILNWPYSVYIICWQSFFSDVFDGSLRNRVYAARSKLGNLFGMISLLCTGLILAYIPHTDGQRVTLYQIFFFIAFVFALIQIWFLSRVTGYEITEKPTTSHNLKILIQTVKKAAADKPFKSFILTAFLFHITWQMTWPLFFIFQVNFLHANEAWLSFLNVGTGLAGVVTYTLWSRMVDRKGAGWVIIIGGFGLALNPLLLVISKSLFEALLFTILVGFLFSAFQLALFENLMNTVPQENKTLNIAIYTTFINISNFASPLVGVWIYKHTSIYFTMYMDSFLRLAATALFYINYKRSHNKGENPSVPVKSSSC